MLVLVVLALALTACQETTRSDADLLINSINNSRFINHVAPVVEHPTLTTEADRWAQEMRNTCTLKHRPNLATNMPAGWTAIAENVANNATLAGAHTAFMNSQLHRDNILNSAYTHVGVGAVKGNCPGKPTYWVVYIFVRLP